MNKVRLIITCIISIFLVSILLIGSTYSIFTSQEIDETANVYKTGYLSVTYKTSGNIQTDPIPKNEEDADAVIPYRITVTNTGNVPYKFDVILTDTTSSTDNTIDYQYIMTKVGYLDTKPLSECTNNIIKEDVILLAGEAVDIDIRVWISDTVPNSQLGKSFYAKLIIDGQAVYNDSKEINNDELSLNYMITSSTSNFRSDTYRTYIKTVSFVDYIDTGNASMDTTTNEVISWNMSEDTNKPNSIVAWLEDNGTTDDSGNKYYDLYIGSKEKIYSNGLGGFFYQMTALENINFDNLDTSLALNFSSLFAGCKSLKSLDISDFDTRNVTSMAYMFQNCQNLTSLDLSNFDTSKVTSMAWMFYWANKLVAIDVSTWDTSSVTNFNLLFSGCQSLTTLDVSGWNTENVTNMGSVFNGCQSLTTLDVSAWNTKKVTTMNQMFRGCNKLTTLDVSDWYTEKVTDMQYMFYKCSKLTTEITIKNTSTTYTNMFGNASTAAGAKIIVNYISATSALVDSMIATKSSTSNVVKGSLV